jgi:hypothetical protein
MAKEQHREQDGTRKYGGRKKGSESEDSEPKLPEGNEAIEGF